MSTRGCFGGRLKQPDENDPENLGGGGLIFNYGSCLRQRDTSYSYIPKPILAKLGNPSGLKFIIRGEDIVVCKPDE